MIESTKTVLRPSQGKIELAFNELWEFKELLYFLTWRDIKIRYKQTLLGVLWVILQPLLTMVLFSIIFGKLSKMPSEGLPYPIFCYAALLPWNYFSHTITQASNTLVSNSNLISKIYFPRLLIPISVVLVGVLDFIIASTIFAFLLLYYHLGLTKHVIFLPFFLGLGFITTLGVGFWFSALQVKYRDVRHLIPFVTQFWMFMTPVIYPSSLLSDPWKTFYGLNPMVGVIEGMRWSLLNTPAPSLLMIGMSTSSAGFLFFSGFRYFRKAEKHFADLI